MERGGADLKDLELKELKNKLSEHGTSRNNEKKIEELKKEIERLSKERMKYRIVSREIALWGGLVFGIIIATVGVRTLEVLAAPASFRLIQNTKQITAFKIVDILLTGSVLAGGSESINKITKVYTNYMQTTAEKVQRKAP